MPEIGLDHSDAIELAEMLTFLADWLSGAHKQTLADSQQDEGQKNFDQHDGIPF